MPVNSAPVGNAPGTRVEDSSYYGHNNSIDDPKYLQNYEEHYEDSMNNLLDRGFISPNGKYEGINGENLQQWFAIQHARDSLEIILATMFKSRQALFELLYQSNIQKPSDGEKGKAPSQTEILMKRLQKSRKYTARG